MRVGIDIGGTFTDVVAISDDGKVRTFKTASTPADYSVGIVDGLQALLRAAGPNAVVEELLHATTIGSNTVLEGKTARTALITTRGFRDVLEIRDLRMPRLYDINWTKPTPLVPRHLRLEVTEKTRADGSIAIKLDIASLAGIIRTLQTEAVQSVAICLLHSYANPEHEKIIATALRQLMPHLAVSVSHEILPEIKEYPRTSTTVINAAIQPVVRAYLKSLQTRLDGMGITAAVRLMQSNGGLASSEVVQERPSGIVESGPAAGVVGAAALSMRLGAPQLITFDMGGTTAKAGLVENGQVLRTEAMEIGAGVLSGARLLVGGGYMLKLPAVDLAEIGAGGGSICRIDPGGAPKVGPQSAGADPGPVCYKRGGTEPTITDCNLVLGYLDPAGLAGGTVALDVAAATQAIEEKLSKPLGLSVPQAAMGMLRIATATMMRAIRAVSVERGRDVRACSMMAFGGNGPMFAASIARELGIASVIIPPMPGLFSAFGLLLADTEHHLSRSISSRGLTPDVLQTQLAGLLSEGERRLEADGFTAQRREARISATARYAGQSSDIVVPLRPGTAAQIMQDLPEAFAAEHEKLYGFRAPPGEPVEITGLALLARGIPTQNRLPLGIPPSMPNASGHRPAWFDGIGWTATPIVSRGALTEFPRAGPMIVQEYDATCVVPPGCSAVLDGFGNIRLSIG